MSILAQYQNGNCAVTLHDDGTKVREWPDGETACPECPESVDLKITNRCNEGCAWCHESATADGGHASVSRVLSVVKGLPAGVEIAIGGGDPLAYVDLVPLLTMLKVRGLVVNMTVRGTYLFGTPHHVLARLQADKLVYGVGISDLSTCLMLQLNDLFPVNGVCHAVVGIDEPCDVIKLRAAGCNVLVLGYKRYGRGAEYYGETVEQNIARWRYFIGTILSQPDGVLSFDNLALEQLDIRSKVSPGVWAERYMGDDGRFTMYFDAVANEYGISSVSERRDAEGMTLSEMFRELPWYA